MNTKVHGQLSKEKHFISAQLCTMNSARYKMSMVLYS